MNSSTRTVGMAASRRKKKSLLESTALWHSRMRRYARPAGLSVCLFILTFVNWFHIPSPFAAAFLLAFAAERPSPLYLASMAVSLGLRFLWGVEPDVWQYAGCAGLWLLLQKCRPRAGVETAALGGLAMMPRILAALASHQPLSILLSCASLPMAMLFSMLMRYGMDALMSGVATLRGRERFCVLLLGLLVISGLGYFWIGGINLGQLAAVLGAFLFASFNGPLYGVNGGLLCGLSLALAGHDCRIALATALCGFFGGLAPVVRFRWLCLPAVLLSQMLAWFVTPLSQPPLDWRAALGALGWMLLSKNVQEKLKPYLHTMQTGERNMESAFVTQRIAHMQTAIENLAHALPVWETDNASTADALRSTLCAQCANRELCWGRSKSRTEKMLQGMMELSSKGQSISEESLPALAEHGCVRSGEADAAVREAMLDCRKRNAASQKARYERELTLIHLAALSGTLGDLGVMAAGESLHDLRAAHVITLAMDEMKIPARLSYARRVDGHLQVALEPEGMMPIQKPLDQLLRYLSQEEEMPLSVARMEKGRIELEEMPLYSASVGMASMCAEGNDEVCGDACCAKRCEGGRLLMMLCDGMGHGEKAHRQSEKTLELLLLLLEAGYTRHQAITAVNGIMLGAQAEERFSTVDLADVDLWTGEVYGEKLGACASWVVRGSHMKKIEGSSLPLGILQEAKPTACQYRLHSGDILVLMSDGVADALGDDARVKKAMEDSLFIQPQRMADALLRNALVAGDGIPRDDMTVMVLLLMDRQHA